MIKILFAHDNNMSIIDTYKTIQSKIFNSILTKEYHKLKKYFMRACEEIDDVLVLNHIIKLIHSRINSKLSRCEIFNFKSEHKLFTPLQMLINLEKYDNAWLLRCCYYELNTMSSNDQFEMIQEIFKNVMVTRFEAIENYVHPYVINLIETIDPIPTYDIYDIFIANNVFLFNSQYNLWKIDHSIIKLFLLFIRELLFDCINNTNCDITQSIINYLDTILVIVIETKKYILLWLILWSLTDDKNILINDIKFDKTLSAAIMSNDHIIINMMRLCGVDFCKKNLICSFLYFDNDKMIKKIIDSFYSLNSRISMTELFIRSVEKIRDHRLEGIYTIFEVCVCQCAHKTLAYLLSLIGNKKIYINNISYEVLSLKYPLIEGCVHCVKIFLDFTSTINPLYYLNSYKSIINKNYDAKMKLIISFVENKIIDHWNEGDNISMNLLSHLNRFYKNTYINTTRKIKINFTYNKNNDFDDFFQKISKLYGHKKFGRPKFCTMNKFSKGIGVFRYMMNEFNHFLSSNREILAQMFNPQTNVIDSLNKSIFDTNYLNMYVPFHEKINENVIKTYRHFGIFLGLAFFFQPIQLNLSPVIFKYIANEEIKLSDILPIYMSKQLKKMNKYTDKDFENLYINFTIRSVDSNGKDNIYELCVGGNDIDLCADNFALYQKLLLDFFLVQGNRKCILDIIKDGFYDVVNYEIQPINPQILFLLINKTEQLPNIIDWIEYTNIVCDENILLNNDEHDDDQIDQTDQKITSSFVRKKNKMFIESYGKSIVPDVIIWFYQILSSLNNDQHQKLLRFICGIHVLPIGGLKKLFMDNLELTIEYTDQHHDIPHFPTSSTCFRTINIPYYESKEIMEKYLIAAIECDYLDLV